MRSFYRYAGNHSFPSMKSMDENEATSFSLNCRDQLTRLSLSAPGPKVWCSPNNKWLLQSWEKWTSWAFIPNKTSIMMVKHISRYCKICKIFFYENVRRRGSVSIRLSKRQVGHHKIVTRHLSKFILFATSSSELKTVTESIYLDENSPVKK